MSRVVLSSSRAGYVVLVVLLCAERCLVHLVSRLITFSDHVARLFTHMSRRGRLSRNYRVIRIGGKQPWSAHGLGTASAPQRGRLQHSPLSQECCRTGRDPHVAMMSWGGRETVPRARALWLSDGGSEANGRMPNFGLSTTWSGGISCVCRLHMVQEQRFRVAQGFGTDGTPPTQM